MREKVVWDGKKISGIETNFEFFQLLCVLRQENMDSCTISGLQAGNIDNFVTHGNRHRSLKKGDGLTLASGISIVRLIRDL